MENFLGVPRKRIEKQCKNTCHKTKFYNAETDKKRTRIQQNIKDIVVPMLNQASRHEEVSCA
jgi:hypothetical protein